MAERVITPKQVFHAEFYLKHNSKRQEHLASLNLPIEKGMTVFETGAGIGDHTKFFVDAGCVVTPTEGRRENWLELRKVYPNAVELDLENTEVGDKKMKSSYDIVYCYGTLYHIGKPLEAIDYMSKKAGKYLFLETCVTYGDDEDIGLCREQVYDPSQSLSGVACRPTRSWIVNRLKERFDYVYVTTTQPNHPEFPVDWTTKPKTALYRSVFVASREPIKNKFLTEKIPLKQTRIK